MVDVHQHFLSLLSIDRVLVSFMEQKRPPVRGSWLLLWFYILSVSLAESQLYLDLGLLFVRQLLDFDSLSRVAMTEDYRLGV